MKKKTFQLPSKYKGFKAGLILGGRGKIFMGLFHPKTKECALETLDEFKISKADFMTVTQVIINAYKIEIAKKKERIEESKKLLKKGIKK